MRRRNERVPHRKQTPEVSQCICRTALWVSAEKRYMNKIQFMSEIDQPCILIKRHNYLNKYVLLYICAYFHFASVICVMLCLPPVFSVCTYISSKM